MSSSAVPAQAPGQVCDRCRRRKIRCRGNDDECVPCQTVGAVCVRSKRLQRNRKRKDFYENEATSRDPAAASSQSPVTQSPADTIAEREAANHEFLGLRPSTALPHAGLQQQGPGRTAAVPPVPGRSHLRALHPTEKDASRSTKTGAEPVIGHMGRLVSDGRNVAMFAGSSTGVHFVSQAEQQLQMQRMHTDAFPSSLYSLHLHDIWGTSSLQTLDSGLIAAIIGQLPLDAASVLERTNDEWTPIYPVVHKPTMLEAFHRLSRGELSVQPETTHIVVVLYQVLALLALGTVGLAGDCVHDHYHFLCQSDRYYSLSTTILDKVLERPSLQTLQGLEIIQIYLQISSRYDIASNMGGTATRMAQRLGLHRHSHRFKFDPLETELRRRAWWCQYALDSFSSAYHGLPRLIRDQDVDTDLPTNVDHELLSRSHVAFPLPGESSQVDTALCLFKIARITGSMLENLYTTTRRRGGVAKILRLQAELDMWYPTAGIEDAPVTNEPFSGHVGDVVTSTQPTFATTFLKVVHAITTIHLHRPALAFTSQDPHSISSLHVCVEASQTLITILSTAVEEAHASTPSPPPDPATPSPLLLILLYPSGTHMLWQAGLTILYAHWKLHAGTPDAEPRHDSALENDRLVRRAASALELLRDMIAGSHGSAASKTLGECAAVLGLLREKTFSPAQEAASTMPHGWDQLSSNLWEWPMDSALELANTLETAPMDLFIEGETWL